VHRIFISYSHKDNDFREDLDGQLAALKRKGAIDVWADRKIGAGNELDGSIFFELDRAHIVLLLVSSDYLNSNYCVAEMRRAMNRHDNREARVIPVILRPCDWHDEPFAKLLAAPRDAVAITQWSNRDAAFLDVVQQIKEVLGPAAPEKLVSEVDAAAPMANSAIIAASAPDQTRAFACSSPASVSTEIIKFDYSTNDGKLRINRSGKVFDVRFSKASNTSIHLYVSGTTHRIARVKRAAINLPTTIDEHETSSRSYTIETGERFLVENDSGDTLAARVDDIKDDSRGADRDEVGFVFSIFEAGTPVILP
jgi:hypothetical protein